MHLDIWGRGDEEERVRKELNSLTKAEGYSSAYVVKSHRGGLYVTLRRHMPPQEDTESQSCGP